MKSFITALLLLVCLTAFASGQVTDISVSSTEATVNDVEGVIYDAIGDDLHARATFSVVCGANGEWVSVTTTELDGDIDPDVLFVPTSTGHPIIMSDSYTVAVPMATVYTCSFEVESDTEYNGKGFMFTLDGPGL